MIFATRSSSERLSTAVLLASTALISAFIGWSISASRRWHEIEDDGDATENPAKKCIYMDYNGTTPVYPNVWKAMMPYIKTHFGNPSSSHAYGSAPRQAIDQARRQILTLLGTTETTATPLSSVWFTACGTESDNLAIQLAVESTQHQFKDPKVKPRVITSNVEHAAVSAYLQKLEMQGQIDISYVPVQSDGRVLAKDVIATIEKYSSTTILVTIMLANNESGAIQPIADISRCCRKHNILMHTDAAQATAKISITLEDLGHPDMISIVGHKMGAPKGVAVLYVRDGCLSENGRLLSSGNGVMMIGGGQEFGNRAGTQNTPYIVGMGVAAQYASKQLEHNKEHCESLRSRLLHKLTIHLGENLVRAHGPSNPNHRLPNTLSVGLRGVHSGKLLQVIGDKVAASAGATCHSANAVSSVLHAMNISDEWARGTLRLSLGPTTTMVDVDRAALIIATAAQKQVYGGASS